MTLNQQQIQLTDKRWSYLMLDMDLLLIGKCDRIGNRGDGIPADVESSVWFEGFTIVQDGLLGGWEFGLRSDVFLKLSKPACLRKQWVGYIITDA